MAAGSAEQVAAESAIEEENQVAAQSAIDEGRVAMAGKEDKPSSSDPRNVPAKPLTASELRNACLQELDPDWVCVICMTPYDNTGHMPMRTASCYEKKPNRYVSSEEEEEQDKARRGSAPPCAHKAVICEPCSVRLMSDYANNRCPSCRNWIKTMEVDVQLLHDIVSSQGGLYVSLVRQLNEAQTGLEPLSQQVQELKKALSQTEKIAQKLENKRSKLETANSRVIALNRELSEESSKRKLAEDNVRVLGKFREDKLKAERRLAECEKIAAMLFEEIIGTRLRQVACGMLTVDQLGMKIASDASGAPVVEDAAWTPTYVITMSNQRDRLTYSHMTPQLRRQEEAKRVQTIRAYNAVAAEKASTLPTSTEIAQSFWRARAPDSERCVPMVKVNSWLHQWLQKNMAPEALFDNAREEAGPDMEARYVPTTQAMLDSALKAHAELRAKELAPPPFVPLTSAVTTATSAAAAAAEPMSASGFPPFSVMDIPRLGCCICCFRGGKAPVCGACNMPWCHAKACEESHGCERSTRGQLGEDTQRMDYLAWAKRMFVVVYLIAADSKEVSVQGFAAKLRTAGILTGDEDEVFSTFDAITDRLHGLLSISSDELAPHCYTLFRDIVVRLEQNAKEDRYTDGPSLDPLLCIYCRNAVGEERCVGCHHVWCRLCPHSCKATHRHEAGIHGEIITRQDCEQHFEWSVRLQFELTSIPKDRRYVYAALWLFIYKRHSRFAHEDCPFDLQSLETELRELGIACKPLVVAFCYNFIDHLEKRLLLGRSSTPQWGMGVYAGGGDGGSARRTAADRDKTPGRPATVRNSSNGLPSPSISGFDAYLGPPPLPRAATSHDDNSAPRIHGKTNLTSPGNSPGFIQHYGSFSHYLTPVISAPPSTAEKAFDTPPPPPPLLSTDVEADRKDMIGRFYLDFPLTGGDNAQAPAAPRSTRKPTRQRRRRGPSNPAASPPRPSPPDQPVEALFIDEEGGVE